MIFGFLNSQEINLVLRDSTPYGSTIHLCYSSNGTKLSAETFERWRCECACHGTMSHLTVTTHYLQVLAQCQAHTEALIEDIALPEATDVL